VASHLHIPYVNIPALGQVVEEQDQ